MQAMLTLQAATIENDMEDIVRMFVNDLHVPPPPPSSELSPSRKFKGTATQPSWRTFT